MVPTAAIGASRGKPNVRSVQRAAGLVRGRGRAFGRLDVEALASGHASGLAGHLAGLDATEAVDAKEPLQDMP
jgi:hypothetical protein